MSGITTRESSIYLLFDAEQEIAIVESLQADYGHLVLSPKHPDHFPSLTKGSFYGGLLLELFHEQCKKIAERALKQTPAKEGLNLNAILVDLQNTYEDHFEIDIERTLLIHRIAHMKLEDVVNPPHWEIW